MGENTFHIQTVQGNIVTGHVDGDVNSTVYSVNPDQEQDWLRLREVWLATVERLDSEQAEQLQGSLRAIEAAEPARRVGRLKKLAETVRDYGAAVTPLVDAIGRFVAAWPN